MTAIIARLTGLLLAISVGAVAPAFGGSADRRAEDAAAAAKRATDKVETLRENPPPAYDRRALPPYEDALERAEREAEKSSFEASNAAREAARAARQSKAGDKRQNKFKKRIIERKKRLRREAEEHRRSR